MMTILATVIIALVGLLFAVMAIAPFLIESSAAQSTPEPVLRLVEKTPAIADVPLRPEAA